MLIASVYLLNIPFDKSFYYKISDIFCSDYKIGDFVQVFFGKKIAFGIIFDIFEYQAEILNTKYENLTIFLSKNDVSSIKEINNIIESSFVAKNDIELIKFIASYNFIKISAILEMIIPDFFVKMKTKIV